MVISKRRSNSSLSPFTGADDAAPSAVELQPTDDQTLILRLRPSTVETSPAWQNWQARAKRGLDFLLSLAALIVLAPLLVLIAIAIRLDSRGPVIFRQTRCGKDGKPFTFLKFRSMVVDAELRQADLLQQNEADGPIFKIRKDPRITTVGRFIRRTSLDELPQLLNVLKGEMSLVGPRPPIPSEVAQYDSWQRNRLRCVPGITGLWQVSGRSELTFDEMVELDLKYITNWTVWHDIRIIMDTLVAVVMMRGAY